MKREVWLLSTLLAACSSELPPPVAESFTVVVTARTGDGRGVPGATVSSGDRLLATTGDGGGAEFTATGQPGDLLPLSARCPEGYREAEAPSSVTLQKLRGLDGSKMRDLGYSITCRPSERLAAVVVVRAGGRAGLSVLVDGQQRAVTDARGVAHLGLAVPPNSTLRITLDTTSVPILRPRNPEMVFPVPDRDEVFVFDQDFAEEKPQKKRSRRRRKPEPETEEPPQPRRPVRIE